MTSPHERLDQAMDARRLDLDLRWRDVAAAARVAEVTLRAIRSGSNPPSALTKRRIEEALLWANGSVDAVMSGGVPTPLPDNGVEDGTDLSDDPQELMRQALELQAESSRRLARAEEILERRRGA